MTFKRPSLDELAGYPAIFYTHDGLTVCYDCAGIEDTSDPVTGFDLFYEGATSQCDDCQTAIESAYGDPWTEDDGLGYARLSQL